MFIKEEKPVEELPLHLKYRPQSFDVVVGQDETIKSLKALFPNHVPHAFLFTGPSGTGKTTLARIIAAEMGVDKNAVLEVDIGVVSGVDSMRDLLDGLQYKSMGPTGRKMVILDECVSDLTRVLMSDGIKKPMWEISKDFKKGKEQYVVSMSPKGVLENKKITTLWKKGVRHDLLKVFFKDKFLGCRGVVLTPEHKVWSVLHNDFVEINKLTVGSEVILNNPYNLSPEQEQLIRGSLLGDSSMHKLPSGITRFRYLQSDKQKEYFEWKHDVLKRICNTKDVTKQKNGGWGDYIWGNNTISLFELTKIYDELYKENKKYPTIEYLNKLTPSAIAVWYMDDGSKAQNKTSTQLQLATNGFDENSVHLIADWFFKKYGIKWKVNWDKRDRGFYLTLCERDGSKQFLNLVSPYLCQSMQYKGNQNHPPFELKDSGGRGWSVSEISKITKPTYGRRVFDIEVEDNHNFFAENWLVSNCHMLSKSAWNSILKVLEEPPKHVYWVLCTTETSKIPETIKTRCHAYNLKEVGYEDLAGLLEYVSSEEQIILPDGSLDVIIRKAEGSPRKALVCLSQARACSTTDEVISVLQSVKEATVIELCRILVDRNKSLDRWTKAKKILEDLSELDSESIRIPITKYLGSCIRKSKSDKDALFFDNIMTAFLNPTSKATGMEEVIHSCIQIIFDNSN